MAQSIADISPRDFRRAAALKEKIEALQIELARLLGAGSGTPVAATDGRRKKKRTMSPEARAKIGEAQRKRWAKQKRAAAKAA